MWLKFPVLVDGMLREWFFDPSGFGSTRPSNFLLAQKVTKNAFFGFSARGPERIWKRVLRSKY
ncbi:hypothetical protein [Vibrio quintilis]|uniref:hypothetical protein n=1 Tax=Vibrio quintilis TaxID=1117707 RepID=UPI00116135FB|nr:hypothetical protein [Vibrio quintilis]